MDIIVFGEDSTQYAKRRLSTHTLARSHTHAHAHTLPTAGKRKSLQLLGNTSSFTDFKTRGHSCTRGAKVAGQFTEVVYAANVFLWMQKRGRRK